MVVTDSVSTHLEGSSRIAPAVDRTTPSVDDWADVFGPSAYDIVPDKNRNRKLGRVHLPDVLLGHNQYITDRVDGLITDATNSPFTTIILPYQYLEDPDRKLEWNVWRFDEGLASRVPYESSARTLTQSKESFSGYTVRQGLAITLEHNFMMSKAGMANFQNQIQQVVQSIQNTNDLDVHMALLTAPSYLARVRETYFVDEFLPKALQDYKDNFGFLQKNMNAMDIIIEETKAKILSWGGVEPDFMLCSSKLCFQLTMSQEKTQYLTQGDDGKKLLKQGPTLPAYRELKVIKSKCFSLDNGSQPRDILRRRVRTAEFYVVPKLDNANVHVELYDEGSDNWAKLVCPAGLVARFNAQVGNQYNPDDERITNNADGSQTRETEDHNWLLLRPNIEHYMLGVIIGRGGLEHLGACFWGQTEMSVFDDGQHGVWGMTYKYHERAIVINERNMHRVWDVSYDGYTNGKGVAIMNWEEEDIKLFKSDQQETGSDFDGKDIVVIPMNMPCRMIPSPMPYKVFVPNAAISQHVTDDLSVEDMNTFTQKFFNKSSLSSYEQKFKTIMDNVNQKLNIVSGLHESRSATSAAMANESTLCRMFYQGTVKYKENNQENMVTGCGHHGPDYPGVASVRNGKTLMASAAPALQMITNK